MALAPTWAGALDSDAVHVFKGWTGGYPTYRIPALVVSNQGTVLAFCEGRKTGIADHGNLDLVLRRSFDGGLTWEPLQVIQKKGWVTWGNPAPVVDRSSGRIWLPFCLNNDRVFVTHSDDDGESWAEPREITDDVKLPGWGWYATGPGHAIQLASGRLLVPCDHREKGTPHSHVIYSDDHGQTWKLGGSLDRSTDECMAVQTSDGRLYLTMRNNLGLERRAYAWSDDEGLTWTESRIADELVSPTCQASVVKAPGAGENGRDLLFFTNPASTSRENIAIRVSHDNARTWSEPATIFAGPGAYSDMVVLPGGKIGVIYENGPTWPYSRISFSILDISWILNN